MILLQSPVVNAMGYGRIRAGIVNSMIGGTLRILQGWNATNLRNFAVVLQGATMADPLTGFNAVDLNVAVTRKFVLVRFVATADFVPGPTDTVQFAWELLPLSTVTA